jgi:RNA polymerase sigma factor (sigma-70 family)
MDREATHEGLWAKTMAAADLNKAVEHLCSVLGKPDAAGVTDGELLTRYVRQRDEAAFEALVRRHGPMVLGVCRRVLLDPHDAEDAFQATFLVLVRKAASIRSPGTVGNWLYGVAYRTAQYARRAAVKRRTKEAQAVPKAEAAPDGWAELRDVLDQELERLPEKYRAVVVLCDLQGATGQEAALHLGLPPGTVASRLARGRARLAKQLSRHGLAIAGAALAGTLPRNASAAVPTSLVSATLKAAGLFAGGRAVPGGALSARVVALTEGVLKTMLLTKLKVALMVLLIVCVVGAGVVAAALHGPTPAAEPATAQPAPGQKDAEPAKPRLEAAGPPKEDPGGADLPLPPGALLRLGSARWRCPGGVRCGVFSPDGKVLAVGGNDGVVRLWDVRTGRELRSFEEDGAACPAFSPDGKYLALPGRGQNALALYEVSTGKQVGAFRVGDEHKKHLYRSYLTALAFSPDGKTLVAGTQGQPGMTGRRSSPESPSAILAWSVATGKEVWHVELGPYPVYQVGFSPGGAYLAVIGQSQLIVLDAATRKELHRHDSYYTPFNFDAQGGALWHRPYSDSGNGYQRLDLKTGEKLARRELPRGAAVAGPGGRLLLVPEKGATRALWDVPAGRRLGALENVRGHTETKGGPEVLPLALSPDGKTLAAAVGRTGYQELTVRLFETASGRERLPLPGHREGVLRVAVSRDGTRIASAGPDETVCLWDRNTGKLLRRWEHPERRVDVCFSPDGKYVAGVSGDVVVLWDTGTGKESKRWRTPNAWTGPGRLSHPRFTPDGKRLVTGEGYAQAEVWDPATGRPLALFKRVHGGQLFDMALSPDGRLAALAGPSGVSLGEVATGKPVRQLNPYNGGIQALAFAPDGKTLALAYSSTVGLFPVDGGKADSAKTVRSIHVEGTANAVAFSPDGRMVATVTGWPHIRGQGLAENLVQVWEVATGKERRRFAGHRDEVKAVAFTPDGRAVVSGSQDNTVLVWSLAERQGPPRRLARKELETLWGDLAAGDAAAAFKAVSTLAGNPAGVPAFFKEKLPPTGPADPGEVAGWLADLDHKAFARRERASAGLRGLGWRAAPALRRAAEGKATAEGHRRIKALLDALDPLESPSSRPEWLRQVRLLEVLEHAGTRDARGLLAALTQGCLAPRVTREARAALARLNGAERKLP